MNNVLLSAGKATPVTSAALPLFGSLTSPTTFGLPAKDPQGPFIPLLAPASPQVAISAGLSLTSPLSPVTPPQVSSLLGTPIMLTRPISVPVMSGQTDLVPTATLAKASTEPQKPSTESQVQQLLQLLVGESFESVLRIVCIASQEC